MSDRLLTAAELAERLALSTATVLDRFERGDLPGFRLWGRKGGPVRFRLSDIEAKLAGWNEVTSEQIAERQRELAERASSRPAGVA